MTTLRRRTFWLITAAHLLCGQYALAEGLTGEMQVVSVLSNAYADTNQDGSKDDSVYELQVTVHAGHGKRRSLLGTQFYAEKPLPNWNVSAYLALSRDQEFRSVYAGITRQFGDLQLGIGFGNAWYDSRRHPTVNPWLFYSRDDIEAFVSAEHYSREGEAPWFYKGYVRHRISDSVFVGAYGEKDFGAGPLIGWSSGSFKIWSAVPVVDRPKDGARLAVGLQVEF